MKRIRQAMAAILERKYKETREYRLVATWQTRALAMMIAYTVPIENEEDSKNNPLIEFAKSLTIDPEDLNADSSEESAEADSRPSFSQIKFPILQEVCQKGHDDDWVEYDDYKICRKCDLENRSAKLRHVADLANFSKGLRGNPM